VLLTEIVKLSGGVPRMYGADASGGLKNVPEGTYMQYSERDIHISSSTDRVGGTVAPLKVHLREVLGRMDDLDPTAWIRSVFDLSYMHHGSVFGVPKLPVTTYFSDRLAYMVAKGDIQWDDVVEQRMSSFQQPWL